MRAALGAVFFALLLPACGPEESLLPPPRAPEPAPVAPEPRAAAPSTARPEPQSAPVRARSTHANESCGDLAMTRARITAEGKGENHPEVVSVDALLRECKDKTPSAAACDLAKRERIELVAKGRGENHPDVRARDAQLALCK